MSQNYRLDFLKSELSNEEMFGKVSQVFSLLSDSTRLKIFWLLCHSKECVINIAQIMNMTMPAVSHHLRVLKDSGLIESYRDGKEVFYTASVTEKDNSETKKKYPELYKMVEDKLKTISSILGVVIDSSEIVPIMNYII